MKYTIASILLLASATTFAQTNIFPATGHTGIGTTTPSDFLEIQTGNLRKGISIRSEGDALAYSDIVFYPNRSETLPTGSPIAWWISYRKDGYFSGPAEGLSMEFYTDRKGGGYFAPLSFKPNGDVILASPKNAQSGNVGIGTVNPQEKLVVKGKIVAEEIKVQAVNWPDYVFKPDYKLTSLAETERFIQQNGHLPEIPSSKQIEEEGFSVGEMNKLMMKKIEELTLHLIEKDQQIIQQNQRISEIENILKKGDTK